MQQLFYSLAILVCPVGMGLMMWMMMRGQKQAPEPLESEELGRLRAEIEHLQSGQHLQSSQAGPQDRPTGSNEAEAARLRAEADQLRAAERDGRINHPPWWRAM